PAPQRLAAFFPRRIRCRMADRNDADDRDVLRHSEQLAELVVPLRWKESEDARAEALVDRRKEQQHHCGADVDPPPRNRPVHLCPVLGELVRLAVALVVALLAQTEYEVRRRLRDPRREALRDVQLLIGELGDAPPRLPVGGDDYAVALGEAAARRLENA